MVVRLYETAGGEVLTKYVDVEKPITVTKTVTAVSTRTVNAQQIILKPVKTVIITRYVPKTRLVYITVVREIPTTKVVTSIVSRISKGTVKQVAVKPSKLRGSKEGKIVRIQPKSVPAKVML